VTENDLKAFQQHLEKVISGEAFRGSHRSAQFLRYVVNQSVSGHCDELKERLIGSHEPMRSAPQGADSELPVTAATEHDGWVSRALRGNRVPCAFAVVANRTRLSFAARL
jgi:hypothetical protein